MSIPIAFITYAAPYQDPQSWKRAYGYSLGGHGALVALFFLLAMNAHRLPTTVLTEVNFIEASVPDKAVTEEAVQIGNGGSFSADSAGRAVKAKNEVYTAGEGPVRVGVQGSLPTGRATGAMGSNVPLSGPIVADEPIGWIGRKTGALVELPTRTGGSVGSGVKGKGESAGAMGEPIALSRMGVDDIRKKEAGIGAPLISGSVVAGSLSASAKGLAGISAPGEKRRASMESLKANPLDRDKWGKQKGPFSMEGPLKYRKILKMELPPYPRWAEERALEASVSIRLWVNPKGRVLDNMYLEKTSGYSELDHLAMEAIQKFVFVTLPDNQAQEDEWGVATFRFELKK